MRMINTKDEHVFPKDGGWVVRREGSKKISRLFKNKKDAVQYAGIIASNDNGLVVTHKYNGQFEDFMHGNQIHVRAHKKPSIITGTMEMTSPIKIMHPIVNNTQPIVETRTVI